MLLSVARHLSQEANRMESIKGRGAVVTGASRGIGKAIATALAREGVNLVLAARGTEDLEKTAKELEAEYGVRVFTVRCDVSRREDLEVLAKESVAKLGRVDALINNAGVSSQSLFHKQNVDDIQKLLFTNFFGYVALTRLLINHMVENKGGHVITSCPARPSSTRRRVRSSSTARSSGR
jgi:3-oxoacyl-[acyl-carrier protein] reductase